MWQMARSLVLATMGLFLLTRLTTNTILFYINARFVGLTALAGIGLIVVALALGIAWRSAAPTPPHQVSRRPGLARPFNAWLSLLLVALPALLGWLIPPRPLGAAALSNREVSLAALTSVSVPHLTQVTSPANKNILDWLIEFRRVDDPAAFVGREATVLGFVYRDERFRPDTFMVGRFIVSCCVADADPIGLIVRSQEASLLPVDQWVEVSGVFELGNFEGEAVAVLVAQAIERTDPPSQPYLYP